jgi:hypothetical protein
MGVCNYGYHQHDEKTTGKGKNVAFFHTKYWTVLYKNYGYMYRVNKFPVEIPGKVNP